MNLNKNIKSAVVIIAVLDSYSMDNPYHTEIFNRLLLMFSPQFYNFAIATFIIVKIVNTILSD